MPELPEVEGLRRRLAPLLAGRRLEQLAVLDAKLWRPEDGLDATAIVGARLRSLERQAKLLLFPFEGELTLILHLKIAGQVVCQDAAGGRVTGGHPYPPPGALMPDRATRFSLRFADPPAGGPAGPLEVFVNDQRRFAWLRLMPAAAARALVDAQRYGPDPLSPAFTASLLGTRLSARGGRTLKAALLDQTCIAGIGNIYADEALHRAGLHPATRAASLDAGAVERLQCALAGVLEIAVPVGGALVRRGRAIAEPESGRDFLQAHGRVGERCLTCGAGTIVRTIVAGRGTYYCPLCQPPVQA